MEQVVRAVFWKQVSTTDINTMLGVNNVGTGSGQNDVRIRPNKVSYQQMVDFVSGTPNGTVNSTAPIDLVITQRPLPGSPTQSGATIGIGQYNSTSRNDIRILNQDPPDTNPRWAGVSTSGSTGDYIYVVRLADGSFTSGWFPATDLPQLPQPLRDAITAVDQGVQFFETTEMPESISPIIRALATHHNVLLYGPPGTGKTRLMQDVKRWFANPPPSLIVYDETNRSFGLRIQPVIAPGRPTRDTRWVTFHQSYSYENFIGGRRPFPQTGGGISLVPVDGTLVQLANTARTNGAGLLLVDEINRGNVSRIFGEFITVMEPDKRLREDGTIDPLRTVPVQLPHQDPPNTEFTMPYHVYTLASMNSVDRSIMPLDAALRRRFYTIELPADYSILGKLFGISNPAPASSAPLALPMVSVQDFGNLAIRLLFQVNAFIRAFAGSDFEAGHGFFWSMQRSIVSGNLQDIERDLVEVWNNRLLPHLQELFRSQPERLASLLRVDEENKPSDYPYKADELPEWLIDNGATPGVAMSVLTPGPTAITALRFVARVG